MNTTGELGIKLLIQKGEIISLRQQLAQREAEVAKVDQLYSEVCAAHEVLSFWLKSTSQNQSEAIGKAKDVVYRTKATAEANDAKVWNEAINAVSRKLKYELEETAWFDESVLDVTESLLKPEPN